MNRLPIFFWPVLFLPTLAFFSLNFYCMLCLTAPSLGNKKFRPLETETARATAATIGSFVVWLPRRSTGNAENPFTCTTGIPTSTWARPRVWNLPAIIVAPDAPLWDNWKPLDEGRMINIPSLKWNRVFICQCNEPLKGKGGLDRIS